MQKETFVNDSIYLILEREIYILKGGKFKLLSGKSGRGYNLLKILSIGARSK